MKCDYTLPYIFRLSHGRFTCPVNWRLLKWTPYIIIYSQMCAIKCTVQYSKLMSTGRAPRRGKPFTLKTYISLPLLVSSYIYFIADIYFYIILKKLLEEKASKHDPQSNGSPSEPVSPKMSHMASHFYKCFTSLWKISISVANKDLMLLEEIFIKMNTAANDWH